MIEIEGLPKGWEPVAYRVPSENKDYILDGEQVLLCCWASNKDYLIVERIKPREITLVETDEFRCPRHGEYFRRGMVDSPIEVCLKMEVCAVKIWRIKEDLNEIPRT